VGEMRQVSAITPLTMKCISACNPAGSSLGIAIAVSIAATAHVMDGLWTSLKNLGHLSIAMAKCDLRDLRDLSELSELRDAV